MFQVLVAEDEIWIRKMIVDIIETTEGFQVVGEARNGKEAWDMLQELWPTLVVTDIMMPQRDGLWLVEQIAEKKLPMETIIISGYDKFQYAQQAIKYQVSEYLLKPVKEQELREAMQRLYARLEDNDKWHMYLLKVQAFLEGLASKDKQDELSHQLHKLLDSVFALRENYPSYYIALLRLLHTKWTERLGVEPKESSYLFHANESQSEEHIRSHYDVLLKRSFQAQSTESYQLDKKVIREVCVYLDQHYRKNVSLTEMAERSHMSVSHFCNVFKRQTGLTLINYVNKVRMEKVKQLLLEPDLKIYDIAELVGYATMSYFNRIFKEMEGVSPNEYRKANGI
ncbi:two-component system response regulator YesN [Paenibacillus endophyticus]|uniref:Two-component system response regulator YesN n=1 Tax=Paenibacillus endophyticus TaxID=1294268 RepID=A0A7W5C4G2_9BACL|nr:response regulator [Paenibacillus endophyticus]MBB3150494.1 two-component system response regulator YesN [Paenibacillus endophyticus]